MTQEAKGGALCPEQPDPSMLPQPVSLNPAAFKVGLKLEHLQQWALPWKALRGGAAFIESTCSGGLAWKSLRNSHLEACQQMGFRREVWALPADEAKGDLPYPQAMVEAGATQPKEDGVSDCTSPFQSYDSRLPF